MSLTATDLVYPNGDLLPAMFPDGDVLTVAAVWLTEAGEKTELVEAQRQWVYYRAMNAVAGRLAATPSSESSVGGSHSVSWGADRVASFRQMAAAYLAEYNRLTGADVMASTRPASFTVF